MPAASWWRVVAQTSQASFHCSWLEMTFQNASQGVPGSSFEDHKIVLVIYCLSSLLLGIPLTINALEHLKERQHCMDYIDRSLISLIKKFDINGNI